MRGLLAAAAGGMMLGLAQPPHDAGALAWFALVPLLITLRQVGFWRGLALGGAFGTAMACATALWVTPSLERGFDLAPIPAWLFTGALLGYGVVGFSLFGGLAAVVGRTSLRRVVVWPALWIVVEWARATWFEGVPWLMLGHTQHASLFVLQWAEWGGVVGVGGAIVLANACFAEACSGWWSEDDARRGPAAQAAGVGVAWIVFVLVLGAWRVSAIDARQAEDVLRVGLVQAAVPQAERWDEAHRERNLERHLDLTRRAVASGAEVVVWSETAVDVFLEDSSAVAGRIAGALQARESGSPARSALVGVPLHDVGESGDAYTNSVLSIEADGRVTGRYDKMALLPIMERDPEFLAALPGIGRIIAPLLRGDPYSAGDSAAPLYPGGSTAGVLVCFESNLAEAARARVDHGARWLVNLSNDAFLMPAGKRQHFAQAVFRSVETRTPMVRVANRGISAVVSASGRVEATLPGDVPGFAVVEVHPRVSVPPGGIGAAALPWIACLIVLVAWVPTRDRGDPGAADS